MKRLVFLYVLKPLILVNYWLRGRKIIKDDWFWADALALSWGYTVDI